MRQKRVRSNKQVSARYQNAKRALSELMKEVSQRRYLLRSEYGKPRQRAPLAAIKRGRNSPHSPTAGTELRLLAFGVLLQSIGRVCDDRVNRLRLPRAHPLEAIGHKDCVLGPRIRSAILVQGIL